MPLVQKKSKKPWKPYKKRISRFFKIRTYFLVLSQKPKYMYYFAFTKDIFTFT